MIDERREPRMIGLHPTSLLTLVSARGRTEVSDGDGSPRWTCADPEQLLHVTVRDVYGPRGRVGVRNLKLASGLFQLLWLSTLGIEVRPAALMQNLELVA